MLDIIPFKALRPRPEVAALVAASPYDVVSLSEAQNIARLNPLSFLRVEKTGADLPGDLPDPPDDAYLVSRNNLEAFFAKGLLFQEEKECLYVYRQATATHAQYGLVACISLKQYDEGIIKRHELTRAEKELDRTNHIQAVAAQTGPVFLAYLASDFIDALIERICERTSEYDFLAADQVRHSVWLVNEDREIEGIQAAFNRVESCYIADGHHRAAAAAAVRKRGNRPEGPGSHYDYLLAVLFPHDQLQILPYNRVVRDLNGLNQDQLLKKIGESFLVSKLPRRRPPARADEFTMFLGDRWFSLQAKEGPGGKDLISGLPASLLQEAILKPVLGIEDPRRDSRISFVGGTGSLEEMEEMIRSGREAAAFALYPVSIAQLMQVSDARLQLPPKTTWFEPKLLSGLFVHLLTDRLP